MARRRQLPTGLLFCPPARSACCSARSSRLPLKLMRCARSRHHHDHRGHHLRRRLCDCMPDDHDDPAPDLQELVRKYCGCHAITAQAWRRWDRANTDWQTRDGSLYGASTSRAQPPRGPSLRPPLSRLLYQRPRPVGALAGPTPCDPHPITERPAGPSFLSRHSDEVNTARTRPALAAAAVAVARKPRPGTIFILEILAGRRRLVPSQTLRS